MRTELLTLDHKNMLTKLFSALNSSFCDYCFSNMYLFAKKPYEVEVIFGRDIYLKGRLRDGKMALVPTKPIISLNKNELSELLDSCDFLFPISEEWEVDRRVFKITHSDADTDYIYLKENFERYPGRILSKKRNLVNQFESNYTVKCFPLTPDRSKDALIVLNKWNQKKSDTDYEECVLGLKLLAELQMEGLIFYEGDLPIGFVLGEYINPECFVFIFGKGDINYKGIFPYMYQVFAKILPKTVRYLNLEEDLGIESLKKAKQSFQPDHYGIKLRVSKI